METEMISRADVLDRARVGWIPGTVPYSQVLYHTTWAGRYRQDCSGYVCMCWALGISYSTVSLVNENIMHEIPFADLLPGDALGLCGPGTDGNAGHIQLYEAPSNAPYRLVWEQAGGIDGPRRRMSITPSNYKAYRLNTIESIITDHSGDIMYGFKTPTSSAVWISNGVNRRPAEWSSFTALVTAGMIQRPAVGTPVDGIGASAYVMLIPEGQENWYGGPEATTLGEFFGGKGTFTFTSGA